MKNRVTRGKRVANQRVRKLAARAKAHDAKLLKQAKREDAEGLGTATNASGERYYRIPAGEFDSVVDQLKELTHVFVEAWAERDDCNNFDEGLCRLHEARKNLESAAASEVRP